MLIHSGRIRAARQVILHGRVGDHGAELLADADLTGVIGLTLDQWDCSSAGIGLLTNSVAFAGLTELALTSSDLGPTSVSALANGTTTGNLTTLSLINAQLQDATAAELARGTGLRSLTRLSMEGNSATPIGIRQILDSPSLPALAHVDLLGNAIVESEFLPLLLNAAPRPELQLTGNQITMSRQSGPQGERVSIEGQSNEFHDLFSSLPDCERAKRVVAFRLTGGSFHSGVAAALARGFSPTALKELEMSDAHLGNDGVAELIAAFKDYRIETLRLPYCRVKASGVAALANSPLMASVKVLDLAGNAIGKRGAEALAKSSLFENLESLILTDWKVALADRKVLKDRFGSRVEM